MESKNGELKDGPLENAKKNFVLQDSWNLVTNYPYVMSDSAIVEKSDYVTMIEKSNTQGSLLRKFKYLIRFTMATKHFKKKMEDLKIDKTFEMMEREAW